MHTLYSWEENKADLIWFRFAGCVRIDMIPEVVTGAGVPGEPEWNGVYAWACVVCACVCVCACGSYSEYGGAIAKTVL